GGIVVYKHDHPDWGEKNDEMNIGIIDHTLGTPIDTLLSLEEGSVVSLDMSSIINEPGKYSFALAPLDSNDHVTFHSNEAGGNIPQGYFSKRELWPSLSFTPSLDSINVVLSAPPNDSMIVLNSSSGDSILFEWRFTHAQDVDVSSYLLKIGLPYSGNTRDMDTLFTEVEVSENRVNISKQDLLDMLVGANLSEGVFEWEVTGTLATGEMVAIESHSFTTVMEGSNFEPILPDKYWLYHNYPNPFNPETTISYDLKAWSKVTLQVFDIMGRSIMTLENSLKAPGRHHVQWYGRDIRGLQMASGIYFCHLIVQDHVTGKRAYTHTEKMMIVK
ncbi:uncharacterized protein METZ01_LOCUS300366, partial [marine metagenome]